MPKLFWKNWENCHFVQFSINQDGTINPLWESDLRLIDSPRYHDAMFMGCRGSKFGTRIVKDATHWGIFDLTKPNKPTLVCHNTIPPKSPLNKIYEARGNYVAIKNTGSYLKFYISQHKSVKELVKRSVLS